VSQAAKSVDGVKECKADYKKGTAEVTFLRSKTTPEIIAKVISDKTGYKVTVPKKPRK
jgi:copper chaperone CopZ